MNVLPTLTGPPSAAVMDDKPSTNSALRVAVVLNTPIRARRYKGLSNNGHKIRCNRRVPAIRKNQAPTLQAARLVNDDTIIPQATSPKKAAILHEKSFAVSGMINTAIRGATVIPIENASIVIAAMYIRTADVSCVCHRMRRRNSPIAAQSTAIPVKHAITSIVPSLTICLVAAGWPSPPAPPAAMTCEGILKISIVSANDGATECDPVETFTDSNYQRGDAKYRE